MSTAVRDDRHGPPGQRFRPSPLVDDDVLSLPSTYLADKILLYIDKSLIKEDHA
jgi:hypothetical protein